MDKGPPKDDLTEESDKQVKDDIEKQNVNSEVDKADSEVEKLDNPFSGEESKSEEHSKSGILPTKSFNRIEALKEEEKSQIQDESKQVKTSSDLKQKEKSSDDLKKKLLALERELSVESIESKTAEIFLPSELKKKSTDGTEKAISDLDIKPKRKGISQRMAVLLIIAAATGSAFQSLPYHLRESTWFGVFFFLLLGLNSLYACLCTGWCWSLMEDLWPEYLAWSRVPYQEMANRAVGPWMKYIVAFLVDVTTLVMCGNYIISVSEILGGLLYPYITICYFIIITSIVLLFSSMLGSYRNITYIGASDVILSLLFLLFIVIYLFYDQTTYGPRDYTQTRRESVIMAFAGMSYAFGIGIIMPNIVVEMEDRSKFTESCVTAYMIILSMYTVIAILGYAAYGNKTPADITSHILESASLKKFGMVIYVVQALQVATTFAMYFIPLALALEEFFKCPDRFCPRRATIRLGTIILIMIIILGIPRIITHMDVIAATFLNILSFIFPPIFHFLLLRKQKDTPSRRTQSLKEVILVVEILLLGFIIAIVAVYISVKKNIGYTPSYVSCYLNMSLYPLR